MLKHHRALMTVCCVTICSHPRICGTLRHRCQCVVLQHMFQLLCMHLLSGKLWSQLLSAISECALMHAMLRTAAACSRDVKLPRNTQPPAASGTRSQLGQDNITKLSLHLQPLFPLSLQSQTGSSPFAAASMQRGRCTQW